MDMTMTMTFHQVCLLGKRVCRDRDPDRRWMRLSWPSHSDSCLYLGTFESYYHMKYDDFHALYEFMRLKVDVRAGEFCCFTQD